jgi:hypothetical protein
MFTVTPGGVTGSVTLAPASYAAPVAGATGRSIAVTANATDFVDRDFKRSVAIDCGGRERYGQWHGDL